MALDFPSSPSNGQQYTSGNITWVYDGTKWTVQGSGAAYLPLTGGVLSAPGNLTVRGGVLVGATGAVPPAGVITLGSTLTVATLPTASANKGAKAFVTDANATTFNAVVASGGSNFVPVFSDGTNWRIG